MKSPILKSLFTAMLLCHAIATSAQDFEVNGIFYNILSKKEKTVEVTHGGRDKQYKGCINIPANVTAEGVTYSVKSIKAETFWGCNELTGITLPAGITQIGDYLFYDCTALTSVTLPEGTTTIGDFAFHGCGALTNITLPASLTTIGHEAFGHCAELKAIAIGGNINTIGSYAFEFCNGLEIVSLGDKVTTIGDAAFWGCSSLAEITLPASLTTIGTSAFDSCSKLQGIHIPANVTSIGVQAFGNCPALRSITVASGNRKYDSRNGCNAIIETETGTLLLGCNNTTVPDGIISIGEWAFYNCDTMESVAIPDGTLSIGEWSYLNCDGLTDVIIPASTATIGDGAFYGCTGIETICTNSEQPATIDHYTFDGLYNLATLYVPRNTGDIYGGTEYWKNFGNITELTLTGDVNNDGFVDIADVTECTAMIMGTTEKNLAGDVNFDGAINTADVANVTSIILEASNTGDTGSTPSTESSIAIGCHEKSLVINITNPSYHFGAAQFDLKLPEEIEVSATDGELNIFKGNRATATHTAPLYAMLPDNTLRITIHSTDNTPFAGTEGEIITLELLLDDVPDADYKFGITNAIISAAGSKEHLANCSSIINIKGGTSGIDDIFMDEQYEKDGNIYDLEGRRVAHPVKGGIYIKNGKKFFVK